MLQPLGRRSRPPPSGGCATPVVVVFAPLRRRSRRATLSWSLAQRGCWSAWRLSRDPARRVAPRVAGPLGAATAAVRRGTADGHWSVPHCWAVRGTCWRLGAAASMGAPMPLAIVLGRSSRCSVGHRGSRPCWYRLRTGTVLVAPSAVVPLLVPSWYHGLCQSQTPSVAPPCSAEVAGGVFGTALPLRSGNCVDPVAPGPLLLRRAGGRGLVTPPGQGSPPLARGPSRGGGTARQRREVLVGDAVLSLLADRVRWSGRPGGTAVSQRRLWTRLRSGFDEETGGFQLDPHRPDDRRCRTKRSRLRPLLGPCGATPHPQCAARLSHQRPRGRGQREQWSAASLPMASSGGAMVGRQ